RRNQLVRFHHSCTITSPAPPPNPCGIGWRLPRPFPSARAARIMAAFFTLPMRSTMQKAIPCMMFRGGTSKGAYFLASDLPSDPKEREHVLLRVMGSPDERQIDGIGGAHPLTSKVAIVKK